MKSIEFKDLKYGDKIKFVFQSGELLIGIFDKIQYEKSSIGITLMYFDMLEIVRCTVKLSSEHYGYLQHWTTSGNLEIFESDAEYLAELL